MRRFVLMCTLATGFGALPAQAPTQLLDINTTPAGSGTAGSDPDHVTAAGNLTYFVAFEPSTGRELWCTDGTPGGTHLVKDINPGVADSSPDRFFAFDGRLWFRANDGTSGIELWVTDGTETGTVLIELNPGPDWSRFEPLAEFDGRLWFSATNGVHGVELWATDGSPGGEQMVADINTGPFDSFPNSGHVFQGELYFAALVPGFGSELCKTDGTTAGTVMVANIASSNFSSFPGSFAEAGGELFFRANPLAQFVLSGELFKTDGTTAGTVMVADINGDPNVNSRVDWLTPLGSQLLFAAEDGVNGRELWTTDGTAQGTQLLVDLDPSGSGLPNSFAPVDAGVLFQADRSWWLTDGTANGTQRFNVAVGTPEYLGSRRVLLRTQTGLMTATGLGPAVTVASLGSGIPIGTGHENTRVLSNGKLYFVGDDGVTGRELYVWDPGATAQPIGAGCGQDRQPPSLRCGDPVLGTVMPITGTSRAGTTAIVAVGTAPNSPLQIAPGCRVFFDLSQAVLLAPVPGGANWTNGIAIPEQPVFSGISLSVQALVVPSTIPLGIDWSNGVRITTGL